MSGLPVLAVAVAAVLPRVACAEGTVEPASAEVRDYCGEPTLFVNGTPSTGLMHWNRVMKPEDVAVFREAGVHLYSFMGTPMLRRKPEERPDYGDGFFALSELTPEYVDRTMSMIVANDPEAKVVVRFRLTTPSWWRETHSNECVRVYHFTSGRYIDMPWATPGSASWRELAERGLREAIDMIESRWGHVVIGYHPGMACCAENAYEWSGCIADYSPEQLKAWGRPAPDPRIYASAGIGDTRRLLCPTQAQERAAIDFVRFQADRMADAVCFQARVVKDELRRLGRRKLCGAFYGYMVFPPNSCEYPSSGHLAQTRVLECPDIDFIAAPVDYSARQPGGTALAQLLPDSVRLHGKLYYAEEDTRFHRATEDEQCVSPDADTSTHLLHRNFLDAWSHGGSIWWMDLFGFGWFRGHSFVEPLASCVRFAEAGLTNRSSVAEIAVFASDRSACAERLAPVPLSNELVCRAMREVAACGAPYDFYRFEDLPLLAARGRLGRYRMAVVLNASTVDEPLRETVRTKLCRDGRTVVFTGMPGYICGDTFSATNVSWLTGMDIVECPSRDAQVIECFFDGRRLVYGGSRRSDPQFVISDASATAEGWYAEGTIGRNHPSVGSGVALATKAFPDWTCVLSLGAALPSDLLRRYAARAGVHVYSEHGDQVSAGPGWFSVAAKMPGRHVLHPRKPDAKPIVVDMKRGECRIFR